MIQNETCSKKRRNNLKKKQWIKKDWLKPPKEYANVGCNFFSNKPIIGK